MSSARPFKVLGLVTGVARGLHTMAAPALPTAGSLGPNWTALPGTPCDDTRCIRQGQGSGIAYPSGQPHPSVCFGPLAEPTSCSQALPWPKSGHGKRAHPPSGTRRKLNAAPAALEKRLSTADAQLSNVRAAKPHPLHPRQPLPLSLTRTLAHSLGDTSSTCLDPGMQRTLMRRHRVPPDKPASGLQVL